MRISVKTPTLLFSLLSSSLVGWTDTIDVYFGTSAGSGIHHSVFDNETGSLSTPKRVAELNNAGFITIHPSKAYLYSSAALDKRKDKGHVAAFRIEADKTLSPLNTQSSEGYNPCHVSLDSTGSVLMVANYGSNNSIAAFKVQSDGSLAASESIHLHEGSGTNPKRQEGPHPHSIFSNPANTFAYAPDLGIDQVVIYKLDTETATLTAASKAKVPGGGKGPRHMKFSDDGRFAYVLLELTMEIAAYSADTETGALQYIETVSTCKDRSDIERMSCAEIRIHPNNKFVYCSTRDLTGKSRDTISVFQRDNASGRLTLVQNQPANVAVPRNFNIDPSGRWLIAAGQKSNDLSIFSLDSSTGRLVPHGENIPFNGSPICLEFYK
ncbi:MAG: lactonase family protein [Opitutaceae bacterium]